MLKDMPGASPYGALNSLILILILILILNLNLTLFLSLTTRPVPMH